MGVHSIVLTIALLLSNVSAASNRWDFDWPTTTTTQRPVKQPAWGNWNWPTVKPKPTQMAAPKWPWMVTSTTTARVPEQKAVQPRVNWKWPPATAPTVNPDPPAYEWPWWWWWVTTTTARPPPAPSGPHDDGVDRPGKLQLGGYVPPPLPPEDFKNPDLEYDYL